ncbi:MAG: nuclear transport factor 2 family protein [Pararhodobacter sp.]
MLQKDRVMAFCQQWINDWNAGDVNEIMSHYSDDVDFSSPLVVQRLHRPSGRIKGAKELRSYFQVSLQGQIKPKFSLKSVAIGPDAFVIDYTNHRNQGVSEVFFPDADMMIRKVTVCWRPE